MDTPPRSGDDGSRDHQRFASMPVIALETSIRAPREQVFDLARDIDAHIMSTAGTNERAIAGVTSGLINLGETVTWEARHFGIRQQLTVRITRMDRPTSFTDEMVSGAFAMMRHEHRFETQDDAITVMHDHFEFRAPLGPLGRLAEWLFLTRYMRNFLRRRAEVLKQLAERRVATSP